MQPPAPISPPEELPPPPPAREEHPLKGIGLRLLAMMFMAVMFALGKVVGTRGVSLIELIFYRQALALPLIVTWVAMTDGLPSVRSNRLGAHVSRTVLGLTGMVLNFGSYLLLPLTEATAIGFTMPIFATLLSALLLREATGPHRWAAILLGFVGIIIMVRPDGMHFPPMGLAVALSAAVITACIGLLLRDLGRTERTGAIVFWFTILSIPPLGILMLFVGKAHDPITWAMLMGVGITGGATVHDRGAAPCARVGRAADGLQHDHLVDHARPADLGRMADVHDLDRRSAHHPERPLHRVAGTYTLPPTRLSLAVPRPS